MKVLFTVISIALSCATVSAQLDSLSFEEQFALLEADMDSLSIFLLLDSALASSEKIKYSELDIRTSFNSNVTSGGRNYDFNQKSISPGISFYHSSGLFVDYSGFWNSSMEPSYNLSIFSVGYLGKIGKSWNFTPSYERWWHHNAESNSLDNTLGNTITFSQKYFYASVDYSLLFGNGTAHRVIGAIAGTFKLGKWWKFSSIRITPTASTIFGNSDVTILYDGRLIRDLRTNDYLRANLYSTEFLDFVNSVLTTEEKELRRQILNSTSRRSTDRQRRLALLYLSNPEIYSYVIDLLNSSENQYGIMNYSFSLPITFSSEHLMILLSYTYSIPVNLPGEDFDMDPIGFFGASVIYRIPFNIK